MTGDLLEEGRGVPRVPSQNVVNNGVAIKRAQRGIEEWGRNRSTEWTEARGGAMLREFTRKYSASGGDSQEKV